MPSLSPFWPSRFLAWLLGLAVLLLMLLPGGATAQTGTWSGAGFMTDKRDGHTATLLPDGKVLVAGGLDGSLVETSELYDPHTNTWISRAYMTWTSYGPMVGKRRGHTATLLPGGKVLVAGGIGYLASAELYTPSPLVTATPTVTAITPGTGPMLGGTAVTVTGTNFTGATSATVCGAALGKLAVVNSTTLTGTTAAHAAATCDVVVTTAAGSGTGSALFSYAKTSQTLAFGTAPVLVVGGGFWHLERQQQRRSG